MEKIRKSAQQMIDGVFKRLESRQKPYEKIIINNMQSLYRVIRKGDIVLVEGNSDISRMIKLLTQSSWSHSAFYVGDELIKNDSILKEQLVREFGSGANHMVIEAFTGAGVIASPLHKYEDYNIRLCRPFSITGEDLKSVVAEVIGNLGKHYDNRNILDLGLLLLPPFLNPLKKRTIQACLGNCNEFQVICSGMIAKAFQHVGYPIIPALSSHADDESGDRSNPYGAALVMRHYSQIIPKHFDISPNFQIIKFNIIENGTFNYKSIWAQKIAEPRLPGIHL